MKTQKQYHHKWFQELKSNPTKYKKHLERQGIIAKRWRLNNPERFKKYQEKYRKENINKIRKMSRLWRRLHKEEINKERREKYRLWREKNPRKTIRPGWEKVRKYILVRDKYMCQNCGRRATEVHHLDGSGSNRPEKEKNNDYNNLISLCHKCHLFLELKRLNVSNFNGGYWCKEKIDRNNKIIELTKDLSQTKISKIFHITRQRVNQIVNK